MQRSIREMHCSGGGSCCERWGNRSGLAVVIASAAKQSRSFSARNDGLLRRCAPRNDERQHSRDTICPSLASSSALSKREGAGNTGCWPHPRALRAKKSALCARKQRQGSRNNRHSLRNGLRLIACSPRCAAAFEPPSPRASFAKLDPCIGGSGPHAFARPPIRARQPPMCVHRIPRSTFVTTRNAPLVRTGRDS